MLKRLSLLAVALGFAGAARAAWFGEAPVEANTRAAEAVNRMTSGGGLCGANSEYDRITLQVSFPSGSPFAGQDFKAVFGDCSVEDEYLGEPMEPRASRIYSSDQTRWGLIVNTWATSTTAYVSLVKRVGRTWRQAGSLGMVPVRDFPRTGAAFRQAEIVNYDDYARTVKSDVVIAVAP